MQATRYDKLPNEDNLIGNRIFRHDETYRQKHRLTLADERCRLRKSYFYDENTLVDVLRRSKENRKTKERVAFSKATEIRPLSFHLASPDCIVTFVRCTRCCANDLRGHRRVLILGYW